MGLVYTGLRPFESYDHLESALQTGKNRKNLSKLIEKYEDIMQGYNQVDRLIEQCEGTGKQVMDILNSWTSSGKNDEKGVAGGEDEEGEFCLTDVGSDESKPFDPKNYKECLQAQPPFVKSDIVLKSYQLVGISWLNVLHSMGLGGILADEVSDKYANV
jgi:SWI/SNF-related matrix-associated actin-dependent regulator 1 of chromatin subfamily A